MGASAPLLNALRFIIPVCFFALQLWLCLANFKTWKKLLPLAVILLIGALGAAAFSVMLYFLNLEPVFIITYSPLFYLAPLEGIGVAWAIYGFISLVRHFS